MTSDDAVEEIRRNYLDDEKTCGREKIKRVWGIDWGRRRQQAFSAMRSGRRTKTTRGGKISRRNWRES